MTMRLALTITAMALAAVTVPAAATAAQAPAKAAAESCAAHKFETSVRVVVDGKPRSTKVRLCGKVGQTQSDWANTLKDAVRKVEANATMPRAMKDQITAALNAEVAKIQGSKSEAPKSAISDLGIPKSVTSTLPVALARPAERPPEYSTLPPIPTAPRIATRSPQAAPSGPAPRKPRITINCTPPGQSGGGAPCYSLEKHTQLTIRADENLAPGSSLRFLRRGNFRGEVALAQMRKGQSLRSKLPQHMCAGVVRSDVQIQILTRTGANGASQVVDTRGPFELRC